MHARSLPPSAREEYDKAIGAWDGFGAKVADGVGEALIFATPIHLSRPTPTSYTHRMHIGFMGAGAVGGFAGLALRAAGERVTLLGRESLLALPELRAVTHSGHELDTTGVVRTSRLADLAEVDVCFVTVKSSDTPDAAEQLASVLPEHTTVISLQNGLTNVGILEAALGRAVIPGMMNFNVVREGPVFRQMSVGPYAFGTGVGADAERVSAVVASLRQVGLKASTRPDMRAVQVGKLLLNLNNGLGALTGLTLAESLASRSLRRVFASCIDEGLRVAAAANEPVGTMGLLSPALVSRFLRLPNRLYHPIARRVMPIDPAAKTSTLVDVERGRPTEIDMLNGYIVTMAEAAGMSAPINRLIADGVRSLSENSPPEFWTPGDLVAAVEAAAR